jgi:hypothetical protein
MRREGLFVTTAPAFSRNARDYAVQVTRNFVPVNLMDIRTLRELINNMDGDAWDRYAAVWSSLKYATAQEKGNKLEILLSHVRHGEEPLYSNHEEWEPDRSGFIGSLIAKGRRFIARRSKNV